VVKRVLLSVLVCNGVDLTMGDDGQVYAGLVGKFPRLAMDFGRGLLYYHHVHGKKEE
jgi:hypothetical protein